jgi:4-amino-4-deoxy-L-arabinose transferase-like glycosyltransferase
MKRFDKFDIFIIAATVIVFIIVAFLPFSTSIAGDGNFYTETIKFADYLKGNVPATDLHVKHSPGPDIFFLIPFLFVKSGSSDTLYCYAGVIWSGLWMVISMLLMRRIGRLAFNDRVGKIAALLFVIFPIHIYYSLGILAEPVAFFSIIVFMYGWARWRYSGYKETFRSTGWWLMLFGLAFLFINRPNANLILMFLPVILLLLYLKQRDLYRQVAKGLVICSVIILVFEFAMFQAVKYLPGNVGKEAQSSYFLLVVHEGRFQLRKEPFDWRFFNKGTRGNTQDYQDWVRSVDSLSALSAKTGISKNNLYTDFIVKDLEEHPFVALYQAVDRAFYGHFYMVNSVKPSKFKIWKIPGIVVYVLVHIFINLLNIIILVSAIIFLFRRKKLLLEYWPLWLPWLSLVLFHAMFSMEPRYMLPSKPGIFMMSAVILASSRVLKKWIPDEAPTGAEEPAELAQV